MILLTFFARRRRRRGRSSWRRFLNFYHMRAGDGAGNAGSRRRRRFHYYHLGRLGELALVVSGLARPASLEAACQFEAREDVRFRVDDDRVQGE